MKTIQHHKEQFLNYANTFINENHMIKNSLNKLNSPDCGADTKCLELKILHTLNVLKNTNYILQTLDGLSEDEKHIARLAALYHDIGRFEQFTKYKTFSDAKSINHAALGVKILKNNDFLIKEDKKITSQVLYAVLMHNRCDLPKGIKENNLIQCQIIRDADKLDILRIFGEHINSSLPEKENIFLNIQDEPTKWTDSIIQSIENHQTVKYTDLRYTNDFKLLLGAWVYNLDFPISRQIVKEKQLLNPILSSLPKNKTIQSITQKIYKYLDNQ